MEKKYLLILLLIIVFVTVLIVFPQRKPAIECDPGDVYAPRGFGEALQENRPLDALKYCDKCAPFQSKGDPPVLFTKAFCYCYIANEIEDRNYEKAAEICEKIDEFKDEHTCCSTTEACLEQLTKTGVC